ncbi:MAG: hypothetical protein LQ349_006932 [Xanthoria aureola]|nr:MAG: hypothetical protein LQ349_006932 [Xanthoria aureola]
MATLAHLLAPDLPPETPDDPAIIIPEGDAALTISHGRLLHQCHAVRKQLAHIGLGHGTAVSISLPNSYEFVTVFLASGWQRAVAAPLNPAYKEQEVQFYLDDLDAAAVVVPQGACQQGSAAVLAARNRNVAVIECYTKDRDVCLDVKEIGGLEGKGEREVEDPREEDVALVLHTSGTTGKPKAVPLSHKNLSVSVDNIVKTYEITKDDRTMIIMPLFHVHGLVASFMAALKAGSAVIIPPRLAPSFWKDFAAHKATWYTATPTMHKILLSFPLPSPMPTIRFIRSCSSPLAPQTLQSLEDKLKAPVLEAYAMTEASHQITSNPLPPAPHHAGSVGLPGGDIELRILSPNAEEAVPQGSEGEICIRSSSVTAGYLSNPAANASSFTADGHFFRTGDFGKLDQGGYLYLTGRIKEFINKGGEKISPVEIDHLIAGHELVKDVVAFAMADEVYGQELGVAVMLSEGAALGERELKKWVRERVAPLKVPKKIWFPTEIPKTATGKVQRAKVAEAMMRDTNPK